MKRFILGLIFAVGLSGCANQTLTTFNPTVAAEVERSLTIAHVTYNGASELILVGTRSGQIHGQLAKDVTVVYDKAGDALKIADDLNTAGQTADVLTQVNIANKAITDVNTLVRKK